MSTSTQTFRGKAVPDTSGSRYFKKNITTTTPGSEITLISETVSASTEIYLLSVNVSCFQEGTLKVYIDSDVIASIRTGAGQYDSEFTWKPYHSVFSGEEIAVKFKAMGSKPASNIEVFLQGREIPV